MQDDPNGYHISFFKPATKQARYNRNMVLWLVSIWFVAIFGFQILLKIVEKPTPEPEYFAFKAAWSKVENSTFSPTELVDLGKSSLSVLGKINITPEEKVALDNTLSWTVLQLQPEGQKQDLVNEITAFEKLKAATPSLTDEAYTMAKNSLSEKLSPVLGLSQQDIRRKILPLELSSENIASLSESTITQLPGIMEKYMVHNQSFLTDFKFLGFPFHYFYTAIFLLILFVGLCLIYCIKTDAMNRVLEIAD
jgi:putative solute:sodium symporter small subunit